MATPDAHLPRQVPIDGYGAGFFHFAGMASDGSILALPSGIHAWRIATVGEIDAAALAPVLAESAAIEMLIIGTGVEPWAVPDALRWRLRDAGIGIDAMPTRAAASTYNVLLAEGRPVAAALLALR
ncbi:Mth938-like domain-containing protein [Ancylobacter defluvii]|uniref:Membrane protein n=1 Tax=Ancylobacter defluvii TaxID=1282440 RepID=A0A9W6JWX8_9HYPH|nr:Mth938-like domain-containing protein [Ancylobacter defluvii]MBS7587918.1 Mth938-like domain-containing protein [Ancylobacter defluvii]GLK83600.1 membrane protein [Ancylobacter defluvii]